MVGKRKAAFCILLAASAAGLQALSGLESSLPIPAVVAVGLPVYLAARLNLISGILIYFLVSILAARADISSALFFICTAGSVGLTLGITRGLSRHTYLVPVPAALLVFALLTTVNNFFGICLFESTYSWTILRQAIALIPGLYVFCLVCLRLYMLAEKLLLGSLELDAY
ncbi:MAG TPA: hypothetical protein VN580_09035 [Clostridia bacterium]|nr:hypothetical protein [Clostridia bacterium]